MYWGKKPLSIRKRYKILNDIALRLGENTQATENIKLFIELDTCDSCSRVIADFSVKYKNIKLEILK